MKIGVIGTLIKDHIYLSNGSEIKSFGGIYYTLSILGHLLKETDEIYPVCYLGADIYDEIMNRISRYQNIRLTGINKISQNNTAVKLVYKDFEKRDEFISNLMPPLQIDHFQQVGAMDIWLVNFITGREMSLATFQRFCEQQTGLIYMDFHSLSLDIDKEGRRIPRQLPDWGQWIGGVDILQMNEAEAATLIPHSNLSQDEFVKFGERLVEKMIKIFHITCGSKGSLLFYRDRQKVCNLTIPACSVDEVVDVTGCGDAFAAGFLVHFDHNHDIVAATQYANLIAGVNCTIRGTEESYKLSEFLKRDNDKSRG